MKKLYFFILIYNKFAGTNANAYTYGNFIPIVFCGLETVFEQEEGRMKKLNVNYFEQGENGMELKNKDRFRRGRVNSSLAPLLLIFGLILDFMPGIVSAQSNAPISFTKKEIAFFKWGTGGDDVKLNKTQATHIKVEKNTHNIVRSEETTTISWPRNLEMDGDDNIYFRGGMNQIFVVTVDGKLEKKIDVRDKGGLWRVDGDGNIYIPYSEKNGQAGFHLIKPDRTQTDYKDFDFSYQENGIAYDIRNNRSITITGNDNKPEKLPPHLLSRPKSKFGPAILDFEKTSYGSFIIYTKKINDHLKKINRKIDEDKIELKIKTEKDLGFPMELMGIDDNGDFYFLCAYPASTLYGPWNKATVMIYSKAGQQLAEVPIEIDYFDKQVRGSELAIDIHGSIFQLWASEDGVHILRWAKN